MSLSQVKLSELDALTMLQAAYPRHVTPKEIAAVHDCSTSIVCKMMQRLEAKGLVERGSVKGNSTSAVYIDKEERAKRAAAAQAERDAIVKPLKTNIWTPPLKGYAASFKAAESLAMTVRR